MWIRKHPGLAWHRLRSRDSLKALCGLWMKPRWEQTENLPPNAPVCLRCQMCPERPPAGKITPL
jgi:hypothetical protein